MVFSPESSRSFLTSIFRRNLTLPFFKFCCFFVVLVVSNFFALNMEQFEEQLSVVQFAFCSLINLNNFKYPNKIRLCSQANQNHLLRDFLDWMLLIPGTGNGERGTGNGERGTGNGERETGNGEPGNGEPGTGNGSLLTSVQR